jgi:putative ABC transport system permease protein
MLLVIITATVIALMINNTASGIIDDYKSRFASVVSIVPNMDRMRAEALRNSTGGRIRVQAPIITSEQYIEFGNSEYLYDAVYRASTAVNCSDITAIDASLGGQAMQGTVFVSGDASVPTSFMFSLQGNKFEDFREGLRALAEGRMPEGLNECIISSELAELNGIAVGDTLSFTSEITYKGSTFADTVNIETRYELTVVGIYFDATAEYAAGGRKNAYTNRRNEILTTYETVLVPFVPDHSGITVSATYSVKSPDMVRAFAEELYAKGLNPIFDVTADEASYNKIVGPVEGLKSVSVTFMVIVLGFGGIIIALLSSIAIRERKYEIGVLRAMGMKKLKVALGLWLEMLIITCLCSMLGLVVGTMVAQPVTDVLLERQIEAAQMAAPQPYSPGGMMALAGTANPSADPGAEPLKNIDISLGLDTTLQIMGIALLLASLASLVSISRITKYEPMQILVERN